MIAAEDINGKVLFQDGDHQFIWLGADPEAVSGVVQTNQYLIIEKGRGMLLDPGGVHLFARVVAVVSRYISLDKIEAIFFSHQDPDVSSGIALWLGVTSAKIYVSSLWLRFLPHFGIVDQSRVIGIEEHGNTYKLAGSSTIQFIPAHFLHSTGNYSAFDEKSRILFSGDVGAAVFPPGKEQLFIEDFDQALPYVEPFHKRYMASNRAALQWIKRVRPLNPIMLAAQHGGVYKGKGVTEFLDWFERLSCGIDIIETIYK
ncbi:MAG: FprA family A-type flavoprotein [Treponemataceae bacterium]|nr:FprA family A-type flavoprotein [Treponemataceae bacterium]